VILCDTGPLVALVDRDDPYHQQCVAALQDLEVLISTWPCFTEAMHMLYRAGGHRAQEVLWGFWEDGLLDLHSAEESEWGRMRALMRKYSDSPMDLADASLVTAAEELGLRRVFTTDSHFRAYRIADRHAFELLP
jgi:predicted nucleic acid-binding protein